MKGRGKGKEKPERSRKERWRAECACGEEWKEEKLRTGKTPPSSALPSSSSSLSLFFSDGTLTED